MSRPDYVISVLDKDTDEKGEVGAAWINDDGSIGIKFNPFIEHIPHGDRYAISLFSNNRDDDRRQRSRDEENAPRTNRDRRRRRRS